MANTQEFKKLLNMWKSKNNLAKSNKRGSKLNKRMIPKRLALNKINNRLRTVKSSRKSIRSALKRKPLASIQSTNDRSDPYKSIQSSSSVSSARSRTRASVRSSPRALSARSSPLRLPRSAINPTSVKSSPLRLPRTAIKQKSVKSAPLLQVRTPVKKKLTSASVNNSESKLAFEKANKLLNETMETEKVYLNDLENLKKIYSSLTNITKQKYSFLDKLISFSTEFIEILNQTITIMSKNNNGFFYGLENKFENIKNKFENLYQKIQKIKNLGYLIEKKPGKILLAKFIEYNKYDITQCNDSDILIEFKKSYGFDDGFYGLTAFNSISTKITQRLMRYGLLFDEFIKRFSRYGYIVILTDLKNIAKDIALSINLDKVYEYTADDELCFKRLDQYNKYCESNIKGEKGQCGKLKSLCEKTPIENCHYFPYCQLRNKQLNLPFSKKKIKYGNKFFCKLDDEEHKKCSQRFKKKNKQKKKSVKKSDLVIIKPGSSTLKEKPLSSNEIYKQAAIEAGIAEQQTLAQQNPSSPPSPMYSIFPEK